jgi:hypothetical protein
VTLEGRDYEVEVDVLDGVCEAAACRRSTPLPDAPQRLAEDVRRHQAVVVLFELS